MSSADVAGADPEGQGRRPGRHRDLRLLGHPRAREGTGTYKYIHTSSVHHPPLSALILLCLLFSVVYLLFLTILILCSSTIPCHHRLSVLAFASSAPYALFSLITCSCFFASRAVLLLPLFFYTKPDGNEVHRHGSTTSRAARTWPRSSRPSPTPACTCTSASDPTSAPSGTTGQQPHLITPHSIQ
jgi:hypothetical protein